MADRRYSGALTYDAAIRVFGAPTRLSERQFVTAVGWQQLLRVDPTRVFWQVVNRGATTVYIRFDADIDYTAAIPLAPYGGTASMTIAEDGESLARSVDVYATASGEYINVVEVVGA